MNKKLILEQNELLKSNLETAKKEIDRLNKQVTQMNASIISKDLKISELEKKQSEKINNEDFSSPLKQLEKKVEGVKESKGYNYASAAIGEIVVESVRCSNKLTENGETRYRELVNLILGRSEVSKADILEIVKSDMDIDEKNHRIDMVKLDAKEYFRSVLAQRY